MVSVSGILKAIISFTHYKLVSGTMFSDLVRTHSFCDIYKLLRLTAIYVSLMSHGGFG
jgi:hypothetical protein